jgi:hypothetical protein
VNNSLKSGRILALLAPFLLVLTLPVGGFAQVVLNEVLADPVSDWSGDGDVDFKNDEWVEIANRGAGAIDLSDYWLSDAVNDPSLRYRFTGNLAPGAAFQVTGAMALAWQAENGAGSGALSLSNSGGEVALFRDGPDGTDLVDSISYLSYQIDDDRSLGRVDDATELWILFDGLNLYHGNQQPGSTGCLPSPGEANLCEEVKTEGSSWSGVKNSYPGN